MDATDDQIEAARTKVRNMLHAADYVISKGRCPRCKSPAPHLHPAVQFEGEVETCTHDFHLRRTNQNRPEYIASVQAKRAISKAEGSTLMDRRV